MFYNCDRPLLIKLWSFPLALILIATSNNTGLTQIVPDRTLPQNSVVTPDGNNIEITGGTIKGNNLFHSFEQFSVLVDRSAFFNNPTAIENIIGRVTGSSISQIDGFIRANGSANLFLVNPNGIIFGENAALNLGGSFVGSTANSINFADGTQFSASDPDASALLTVSIPQGLQYGQDNGNITVRGSGNNLFIDFDTFAVERGDRPTGLAVQPEKTLALVGSNIFLEGGNLTANQGNIELGSVTEGTVELIPDNLGWKLNYESASSFQDIILSNAASVEASGNSGGRVNVKGSFVSLGDGSAILTDTLGDGAGGLLTIDAEETEIYGAAENGFTSSLFNNVHLGATGEGGNTLLETDFLYIEDGGQVNVNTYSLGDAGTLTVKAQEIEIYGGSEDGDFPSGLFAQADIGQTGRGGDIDVEASYLYVGGGAEISTTTFGDGDGGNLTVQANEIEIVGGSSDYGSSALSASTDFDSTGNGGNLTIETNYLYIGGGAQATVSTSGAGDAGNLEIAANNIELDGTSPGGTTPSGLFASVRPDATGNSSNIQIETINLSVNNGAQIAVSTGGTGDGGILDIKADNVELTSVSDFGASGLFSSAIIADGNGGDINLNSDRLSITDGATISASNFSSRNADTPPGTGAAGDININVNSLELDTINSQDPSLITASAFARSGGNINLNANSNISLNNSSQITSETRGDGDGGNINIATDKLALNSKGQVSVNSIGLGQAGNIAIASGTLNLNSGKITAASVRAGGGDITLNANSINLNNSSAIDTSVSDSTGGGGNISIDNRNFIVATNNNRITADAVEGSGGNVQINSTGVFFDSTSTITASSQFGVDGIIEIDNIESNKKIGTAQLPDRVKRPNAVIASNCPISKENTFFISGKGGLPEDPQQYLRGQAVWQDLRIFEDEDNYLSSNQLKQSLNSERQKLIEAKNWQINQRGKVELVATQNNYAELSFSNNYSCQ